jgi:hypothetical protein
LLAAILYYVPYYHTILPYYQYNTTVMTMAKNQQLHTAFGRAELALNKNS